MRSSTSARRAARFISPRTLSLVDLDAQLECAAERARVAAEESAAATIALAEMRARRRDDALTSPVVTRPDARCPRHAAITKPAMPSSRCSLVRRLSSWRIDRPGDTEGHVKIAGKPGQYHEVLCFAIAGGIAEGRPLTWPPDASGPGDEAITADLAHFLKFTEAEWDAAHKLVDDVLRLPWVRAAMSELCFRLRTEVRIDGAEIEAIYAEACASQS